MNRLLVKNCNNLIIIFHRNSVDNNGESDQHTPEVSTVTSVTVRAAVLFLRARVTAGDSKSNSQKLHWCFDISRS